MKRLPMPDDIRTRTISKPMRLELDQKTRLPIAVECDYVYWTDASKPFIKDYITKHQEIPGYWHKDNDKNREQLGDDYARARTKAIGHEPGTYYPWDDEERRQEAHKEVCDPDCIKIKNAWRKKSADFYSNWKKAQSGTHAIRTCPTCEKLIVNTARSIRKCKGRECEECAKLHRSKDTVRGVKKLVYLRVKVPCKWCNKETETVVSTNFSKPVKCEHCHLRVHASLVSKKGMT